MNKDQLAGRAKSIAGRIQQQVGKLIGSRQQRVEGTARQIAGDLQERLGEIRQSQENPGKHLTS